MISHFFARKTLSAPNRKSRRLAVLAGLCVVPVLLSGGALSAAATPVTGSALAKTVSDLSLRAEQQQAISLAVSKAQETGEPVPVDGMISPSAITRAMPDGTMQFEASTLPVRVEHAGDWVPVDTTLVEVGEWLEPAASVAPVRFSLGGSSKLAEVQTESGAWITETWPYGDLPAPRVEGDTATYVEVLPDVDLKMIATSTGQASIYVVKTEKAAQSEQLRNLHVIIDGANLSTLENGTAEAEATDGSRIIAGQPLWWDSSDGGTFRDAGATSTTLPVTHQVAGDHVALDVGASVVTQERTAGEDVTYPIFVDPDWSTGMNGSWYTDTAYPDQSYLYASASTVLRMGRYEAHHGNIFFEFYIQPLAGKEIISAQLGATQLQWASCPNSPVVARLFGHQHAGFSWNQQNHSAWGAVLDTKNPGSCGSGPEAVGWNVTGGVKARVGQALMQIGLTPQNWDAAYSRRHFDRAATLYVSYNSRPNVPTDPMFTSPQRACGTASAPAMIGQTSATVQVHQTDPDPGNVDTNFHLAKASNLGVSIQGKAAGIGAQGTKSVTFTGLVNGETYAWYARGSDWIHDGVGGTALCYFTVDTIKPSLPSVSAAAGSTFTVGAAVNLNVTGAAEIAGYAYWITPTQLVAPSPAVPVDGTVSVVGALPDCQSGVRPTVRLACANSTGHAAITVAPTDSLSTLWVSAYDRAGNQSPARGFPLYAGGSPGTPALSAQLDAGHAWQISAMMSPLPSAIPDSNPWIGANGIDLLVPATSSRVSTDLPDPPVSSPVLSTAGGTAEEIGTPFSPVNAMNSFTVSVWLKGGYTGAGTAPQRIAMQGGNSTGSWQLQVTPQGTLAFCLGQYAVTPSSTDRTSNCASGGTLSSTQWQLVTGVWDKVNQQLRLHVGNSITPVAVNGHLLAPGDQSATGGLFFGPAPLTGRWEGLFTNPVIVPGVVDHAQLARIAAFELPFSD